VRQIKGGIGYVESAYADQNKLTTAALLLNKAGKFVAPAIAAFKAAAVNADWSSVENFAIDLNNQPDAETWPIASATFVLLPTNPKDVIRRFEVPRLKRSSTSSSATRRI
jgi:phosphate transport system substrate-binding protein